MRKRTKAIAAFFFYALLAATAQRDGATIVNSGSTNTAGYTITLWTDGTGTAQIRGGTSSKPFSVTPVTAVRFFADLKAARSDGGAVQHCMKSASFGSRTTVQWHGWTSPDLQCPPFTAPVGALAQDVSALESAAGIQPGTLMHRIPLPVEMRKIPTATPEVQPT